MAILHTTSTSVIEKSNWNQSHTIEDSTLTTAMYAASSITTDKISTTLVSLVASSEDPAAATTLTISGLDGDTHGIYDVSGRVIKDGTSGTVGVRLNGDTGGNYNNRYRVIGSGGAGDVAANDITYMRLVEPTQVCDASGFVAFNFRVIAKPGQKRRILGQSNYSQTSQVTLLFTEEWTNTTTNLTSMAFIATSGDIGGTGTYIRIYAMP